MSCRPPPPPEGRPERVRGAPSSQCSSQAPAKPQPSPSPSREAKVSASSSSLCSSSASVRSRNRRSRSTNPITGIGAVRHAVTLSMGQNEHGVGVAAAGAGAACSASIAAMDPICVEGPMRASSSFETFSPAPVTQPPALRGSVFRRRPPCVLQAPGRECVAGLPRSRRRCRTACRNEPPSRR